MAKGRSGKNWPVQRVALFPPHVRERKNSERPQRLVQWGCDEVMEPATILLSETRWYLSEK